MSYKLFLKRVAIMGNLLMVLWILYNGISEGFVGTNVERFSYLVLMALLLMNSWLLYLKSKIR